MVLAHRFLALACAIGLGTNAAVAAVQSSASLSNLSFELTTLDATLPGWFDLGTSRGVTSFSLDISDVGSMASEQLGKGRRGTFSFSDRVGVDLLNADGGLSLSSSGLVASGRVIRARYGVRTVCLKRDLIRQRRRRQPHALTALDARDPR